MKWLALLVVICLLFSVAPAFAWNGNTHKALWKTAITEAGIDLSMCDKSQVKKILDKAPTDPDKKGNKNNHNCYGDSCLALEKANELIEKAKSEEDFCTKMFILGEASHYYTDAKNPAHQKVIESACHTKYEKAVDKFIKKGFNTPVKTKCKKSKISLTFNSEDFNNLVEGIKSDILNNIAKEGE